MIGKESFIPRYLKAIEREWAKRSDWLVTAPRSIYLGGGTPSVIGADRLASMVEGLRTSSTREITVEVNPESVTAELAVTFEQVGVTRVSLGVQSLDAEVLKGFRRGHDPQGALKALDILSRLSRCEISVDLIYGAKEEDIASWERTLLELCKGDWGIVHFSCYALTIERKTALHLRRESYPSDDDLAERYQLAHDILFSHGYLNYEISNWGKLGSHSRHNLLYWKGGDYLGLGCGAHSKVGSRRSWNKFNFSKYLAASEGDQPEEEGFELLGEKEIAREALMLSLRTSIGVPVSSVSIPEELQQYFKIEDGYVALTPRGCVLADGIVASLI